MKTNIITAILFASSASAFYIYEPFTGGKSATWEVGQPASISWYITPQVDPKTCSSLSLELMNGPAENAISKLVISASIPNTASGFAWEKVAAVATSNDYFLRMTCLGQGSQFYSSRFTINNPTGEVTVTGSAEKNMAVLAVSSVISLSLVIISML